ncbi:MAG: neutral zinc metallopeptidase [Betaproteobacteria bacterium]|jgi:predicted metalloprotease
MRTDGSGSDNIEDRRGMGGMRGRRGLVGGGLGALIAIVVALIFGVDPRVVLGLLGAADTALPQASAPVQGQRGVPTDEMGRFVAVVLGDTEQTWQRKFAAASRTYVVPTLVLFDDATPTACGVGQSAMGPFYCPLDQKLYIDLRFFNELRSRFGAPGDFAQAYVIAHEVGHHVQNQLGVMDKTDRLRERLGPAESNAVSVRVELQADCLAGVWAADARSRGVLEVGDVEEALRAAAAVGDDTLQRRSQGRIVPDAFTHGTAEQRTRWFQTGLTRGDIAACDTFARESL